VRPRGTAVKQKRTDKKTRQETSSSSMLICVNASIAIEGWFTQAAVGKVALQRRFAQLFERASSLLPVIQVELN
jgi:hypothetical protein